MMAPFVPQDLLMTVSFFSNNVDQQKHKRLIKQAKTLEFIQAQPEDIWVDLLLDKWPQVLPNYVISRLAGDGHANLVQEYFDIIGSRHHFKNLDRTLDQMEHVITDDMAANLYKTLGKNNPEALNNARDMLAFILSLPQPTEITVVTSDLPLLMAMKSVGVVDHPEEDKMILQTRSRPNRFWIDKGWDQDMRSHLEGTFVAGLAGQGGVQIRHPLALRVQRHNENGVLEWVQQEKIYGFSLIQGEITPLSAQQLTHSHCRGPNGEQWPLEAGTHIGHTDKDFAAFKKRRKH